MTNELSANLDQPPIPASAELPDRADSLLTSDINKARTAEMTDGDSETADTTLRLSGGVSARGAGTTILRAEVAGDDQFGDLEDVDDRVLATDMGTTVGVDRAMAEHGNAEAALNKPQVVSERNANIRSLATELASLSPEDRAQHPSYRGERQDGEFFSDIRLTYEGRDYIALTPSDESFRREFEQRIAGLSWEGIDTPPPGVETGVTYTDTVGEEIIICNPAAGKPAHYLSSEEMRAIPDSHLESMIAVAEYHANRGNMIDRVGRNFFYDSEAGFTVIDCEPAPPDLPYSAEMIFSDFIVGVAGFEGILAYNPTKDRFLAQEEFRIRAKDIQQRQWGHNG